VFALIGASWTAKPLVKPLTAPVIAGAITQPLGGFLKLVPIVIVIDPPGLMYPF